jgi:hypothetical protein
MRGDAFEPEPIFSYITTAQRVPQNHPLRPVRAMADEALRGLSPEFDTHRRFDSAWWEGGRRPV